MPDIAFASPEERSFFDTLALHGSPKRLEIAHKLLDWSRKLPNCTIEWDGQHTMVPTIYPTGHRHAYKLFGVCAVSGYTYMYVKYLDDKPPFDDPKLERKLRRKMSKVPGQWTETNGSRKFKLVSLLRNEAWLRFTHTFEWVVQQLAV